MNHIRLLFVVLFLVALGTGIVVGMGVSRNTIAKPPEHRSFLADQLDLTDKQNDQLKAIWSDLARPSATAPGGGATTNPAQGNRDRREQLREQRDQSIVALLTDSQKPQYDDIQKKYRQQVDQLDEERRQALQVAVDKTKAILTDAQRAKYEEILKSRGSRDRAGRSASSRHAPTSQPATTTHQM